MIKRHRCMMMKATEQHLAIKPSEAGQVSRAGAAKCFGIEIQKLAFHNIGLEPIPATMYLQSRDR